MPDSVIDTAITSGSHDPDDKRGHKGPERRCIVTRELALKVDLIRFVVSPDNQVVPDILEKLPGRGAYIKPQKEVFDKAMASGAFKRAFKKNVTCAPDLGDMLISLLRQRVLGLINMAMKADQIALGFDQTRALAQSGKLAIRVEARDGAADGRGKIRTLAKAVNLELERPIAKVIGCFTALELGQIVGRPPLVHAGIERGRLAKALNHDVMRLSGFMPLIPPEWEDRRHEV